MTLNFTHRSETRFRASKGASGESRNALYTTCRNTNRIASTATGALEKPLRGWNRRGADRTERMTRTGSVERNDSAGAMLRLYR